ncbi:MAG TPA: DUF5110 domain-containing protein, partial [Mycobacteriales bacterium]|nr:DUF5110 domain-containing protein [Mycobacteriales bacterium]
HTPAAPRDHQILTVFGAHPGSTRLYDDAGTGFGYQHGAYTWTEVRHTTNATGQVLTIGPAVGSFPGELRQRSWTVVFRDVARPTSVTVAGSRIEWSYDSAARTLTMRTSELSMSRPASVVLAT